MSVYCVSYDLNRPGQNYARLEEAIKLKPWAKLLETVWLIDTAETAPMLRDRLGQTIDQNDRIIVIEVTRRWAAANLPTEVVEWMNQRIL